MKWVRRWVCSVTGAQDRRARDAWKPEPKERQYAYNQQNFLARLKRVYDEARCRGPLRELGHKRIESWRKRPNQLHKSSNERNGVSGKRPDQNSIGSAWLSR